MHYSGEFKLSKEDSDSLMDFLNTLPPMPKYDFKVGDAVTFEVTNGKDTFVVKDGFVTKVTDDGVYVNSVFIPNGAVIYSAVENEPQHVAFLGHPLNHK